MVYNEFMIRGPLMPTVLTNQQVIESIQNHYPDLTREEVIEIALEFGFDLSDPVDQPANSDIMPSLNRPI